ncbi:MAG: hypothetical protein ACI30M_04675 [Muribaculaceae bacterium]
MDVSKITEFTFSLRIPGAAQMIVMMCSDRTFYRFFAEPTYEEGRTACTEEIFRRVCEIFYSESDNSRPLPDDLQVQAYAYIDDERYTLPDELFTADRLEEVIQLLSSKYEEYRMLKPFL